MKTGGEGARGGSSQVECGSVERKPALEHGLITQTKVGFVVSLFALLVCLFAFACSFECLLLNEICRVGGTTMLCSKTKHEI